MDRHLLCGSAVIKEGEGDHFDYVLWMQGETLQDPPQIRSLLGLPHEDEEQYSKLLGDDMKMKELRNLINETMATEDLRRILLKLLNRIEDLEWELDSNGLVRQNDLRRMQEDICMKTQMELIDFL